MRRYFFIALYLMSHICLGQEFVTVVDGTTKTNLIDVNVRCVSSNAVLKSDENGKFMLPLSTHKDTISLSRVGYAPLYLHISDIPPSRVLEMSRLDVEIEEVSVTMSTGYYSLPRERATGSFSYVGNKMFNRVPNTNILERLEGISNGLLLERRNMSERTISGTAPVLRGMSTINSNYSPLIVIDNFPYEGDINNINPNTIESVTLLKDAAAASIWGAKAGNGVIVITTKSGMQPDARRINAGSSLLVSSKPDLFYSQAFIPSDQFIAMEYSLFQQGLYAPVNTRAFSPVIEHLWTDPTIDLEVLQQEYGSRDLRKDVAKYLYRPRKEQQYFLDMSGRGERYSYFIASSLDKNQLQNIGDDRTRGNLRSQVTILPVRRLSLDLIIDHTFVNQQRNGFTWSSIRPAGLYPYATLTYSDGAPSAIPQNYRMAYVNDAGQQGLKDWLFRPLEELQLNHNVLTGMETRIGSNISYELPWSVRLSGQFQYYTERGRDRSVHHEESYHVRNLINRFTQANGVSPIPSGGILDDYRSVKTSLSGRIQLTQDHTYAESHRVTALLGGEIREVNTDGSAVGAYGYNDNILTSVPRVDYITRFATRPTGSAQIPILSTRMIGLLDRYISYFANAAYDYKEKYVLSGSARVDGSNLFGVKTNQRMVPLWSTGFAWNAHNESFLRWSLIERLRLRYTMGVAGNIDKSTTAYPVGRYDTDNLTGLRMIRINSPGNPQLRWEKVYTQNLGLDFALSVGNLSGTIEYFTKNGRDLIGDMPLDPTTGYFRGETGYFYKVNYADILTRGLDIEISTGGQVGKLQWNTSMLYNHVREEVSRYDFDDLAVSAYYSTYINSIPRKGYPVYGLYSNPWYGLDEQTGDPLVLHDGDLGTNYTSFIQNLTVDDLIFHGSQIPTHTGALRNSLTYGGITVGCNITWKAGYYFRRNSVQYNNLFNNWQMHADFSQRWQSPGDELATDVPSMPTGIVANRDLVYQRSSILVEKGDHIRLQDIHIDYKFDVFGKSRLAHLSVYAVAQNLGILWRANNKGIDPDRPYVDVLFPRQLTFGVRIGL